MKKTVVYLMRKFIVVTILMLAMSIFSLKSYANNISKTSSAELFDRDQVVNTLILQQYQQLHEATQQLEIAMAKMCQFQGNNLDQIQSEFIKVRFAWAKAQIVSFGPVSFLRRKERFDFWPDKHRVGERQIRNLLNDASALPKDLLSLQNKSVAIQGLGALERMIFATSGFSSDMHCQLSVLITQNLSSIAQDIFQQWSEEPVLFKNDLLDPQSGVTFFGNTNEVVSTIVNDMATQIRIVSDIKLVRALAKLNKKEANVKRLEAWRTGKSFKLMQFNIVAVKSFYVEGFSNSLKTSDFPLHKQFIELFDQVIQRLNALDQKASSEFDTMLSQRENIKNILSAQAELRQIDNLIKNQLIAHYGLSLKFNALDGD